MIQATSYLVYECENCGHEVIIEGEYGFVNGHNICLECADVSKGGILRGWYYLLFKGSRSNPVKLTRGSAQEDLEGVGL